MNDECVTQSNLQDALRQEAYLLFYVRQSEIPVFKETKHQQPLPFSTNGISSTNSGPLTTSPAAGIETPVLVPVGVSTTDTATPLTNGKGNKKRKTEKLDDFMKFHEPFSKKIIVEKDVPMLPQNNTAFYFGQQPKNGIFHGTASEHKSSEDHQLVSNGFSSSTHEPKKSDEIKDHNLLHSDPQHNFKNGFHQIDQFQNVKLENEHNGNDQQHVTCPNSSVPTQVAEPSIGDTLHKNGIIPINKDPVEKIVGNQLVRELEQTHKLSKVEKFQPWALDDTAEQEAIQQEKKQQIQQINVFQKTLPKKRRRSDWDKELDKGRVKKVRTKKNPREPHANVFQQLAKKNQNKM